MNKENEFFNEKNIFSIQIIEDFTICSSNCHHLLFNKSCF